MEMPQNENYKFISTRKAQPASEIYGRADFYSNIVKKTVMHTSICQKTGMSFIDLLCLDYSTFIDIRDMVMEADTKESIVVDEQKDKDKI